METPVERSERSASPPTFQPCRQRSRLVPWIVGLSALLFVGLGEAREWGDGFETVVPFGELTAAVATVGDTWEGLIYSADGEILITGRIASPEPKGISQLDWERADGRSGTLEVPRDAENPLELGQIGALLYVLLEQEELVSASTNPFLKSSAEPDYNGCGPPIDYATCGSPDPESNDLTIGNCCDRLDDCYLYNGCDSDSWLELLNPPPPGSLEHQRYLRCGECNLNAVACYLAAPLFGGDSRCCGQVGANSCNSEQNGSGAWTVCTPGETKTSTFTCVDGSPYILVCAENGKSWEQTCGCTQEGETQLLGSGGECRQTCFASSDGLLRWFPPSAACPQGGGSNNNGGGNTGGGGGGGGGGCPNVGDPCANGNGEIDSDCQCACDVGGSPGTACGLGNGGFLNNSCECQCVEGDPGQTCFDGNEVGTLGADCECQISTTCLAGQEYIPGEGCVDIQCPGGVFSFILGRCVLDGCNALQCLEQGDDDCSNDCIESCGGCSPSFFRKPALFQLAQDKDWCAKHPKACREILAAVADEPWCQADRESCFSGQAQEEVP